MALDSKLQRFFVKTFEPRFGPDFVALNREWIETYFVLEPMDLAQLEKPQEQILAVGGEVFFVLDGERVLGTCAMIPHGEKSYELAKMAVSPSARGLGIGNILMETAIEWAKEKGARQIMLLSNTILEPAISLYKKHGFVTVHLGSHPDYKRCNIEMLLKLT